MSCAVTYSLASSVCHVYLKEEICRGRHSDQSIRPAVDSTSTTRLIPNTMMCVITSTETAVPAAAASSSSSGEQASSLSSSSASHTEVSQSYQIFLQSTLSHLRAYRTGLQKQQEPERAQKLGGADPHLALHSPSGRAPSASSGTNPSSRSTSSSSSPPPSNAHSHHARRHNTVRRHKAPAVRVRRVSSRRVTA
ncbi:hypothetical protein K431DRAFT_154637 [Polychaeton citri CBS 116435]|uniref:Uncharacterized protein n=1 Tax=Polychaeton citri CBS 116435 TaxID=1314669 RepID=A0A9P4QG28_9PEZI|nr:hypothetical protein K431DRAFT_154637 [Polychaeton citri CBS 116435]